MECENNLLKWRGMVVPQKIVYKTLVLTVCLSSLSIADTRTLYNPVITSHIIDQADKAMVKDLVFLIEYLLCRFNN